MASISEAQPLLDHIVLLVSHATLRELPDRLQGTFTVAPGGAHDNGIGGNKLILFEDGVYIELIAFWDGTDPEKRKQHRWGQLDEGRIVDWACSLVKSSDFAAVQQRVSQAKAGALYDDTVPGGRTRPDGVVLKWMTASGKYDGGKPTFPGQVPFWCLDMTPRNLRVPYQGNPETSHPCGAKGISRVSVSVPESELDMFSKVYSAIYNVDGSDSRTWHFAVPSGEVQGSQSISLSAAAKGQPEIRLTLLGGSRDGPSSVELIPGVVVDFEQL
jgi:hypothetical protein